MRGSIVWLSEHDSPDAFPPVDRALVEPDGLLAAGGDLSPARTSLPPRSGAPHPLLRPRGVAGPRRERPSSAPRGYRSPAISGRSAGTS